jgi:hypothetical protein
MPQRKHLSLSQEEQALIVEALDFYARNGFGDTGEPGTDRDDVVALSKGLPGTAFESEACDESEVYELLDKISSNDAVHMNITHPSEINTILAALWMGIRADQGVDSADQVIRIEDDPYCELFGQITKDLGYQPVLARTPLFEGSPFVPDRQARFVRS